MIELIAHALVSAQPPRQPKQRLNRQRQLIRKAEDYCAHKMRTVQSALDALTVVPHSVNVTAGVCPTQNKPIAATLPINLPFIIPLPFLDALSVPSCLPFNTASSHSDQDKFSDEWHSLRRLHNHVGCRVG